MNKSRLEAFTDAIIAIAATIMVLELHAPETVTLTALFDQWPIFLAYIISFSLIYIVWYSHHNAFKKAAIITTKTYLLNGLWLFFLTLVPFATSWVGSHPDQTLTELLYVIVMALWSIAFQLLDNQILRDNPNAPKDDSVEYPFRLILYGTFIVALAFAFIIPVICLILIGLISMMIAFRMVRTNSQNN